MSPNVGGGAGRIAHAKANYSRHQGNLYVMVSYRGKVASKKKQQKSLFLERVFPLLINSYAS